MTSRQYEPEEVPKSENMLSKQILSIVFGVLVFVVFIGLGSFIFLRQPQGCEIRGNRLGPCNVGDIILDEGEILYSSDGAYYLIFQNDGNLTIRKAQTKNRSFVNDQDGDIWVWRAQTVSSNDPDDNSRTEGFPTMEGDEFIIDNMGRPIIRNTTEASNPYVVWCLPLNLSEDERRAGIWLEVTNEGQLRIYTDTRSNVRYTSTVSPNDDGRRYEGACI